MRFLAVLALIVTARGSSLGAQSTDDALLIPHRALAVGVQYAHSSWDEYWEGALKRSNGNIGTLTTQSVAATAAYGVTGRFTLMAVLPWIRNEASLGTLHGLSGMQDLTVAAKYKLLSSEVPGRGIVSLTAVASASLPMTDYTPDFLPLSIGTAGGRSAGRLLVDFDGQSGWFAGISGAYTWCANVTLDRSAYYTDGQLHLTNKVQMPDVADYAVTVGAKGRRWRLPLRLVQQRTLGGGDIRRQDMPFVSNRMDFTRLDAGAMYGLTRAVTIQVGASGVLTGRNVGQATTLTSGVSYALHF